MDANFTDIMSGTEREVGRTGPESNEGNCVIIHWEGKMFVYDLDEPYGSSAEPPSVPAWAQVAGILQAIRTIMEVPELESILSHVIKIKRQHSQQALLYFNLKTKYEYLEAELERWKAAYTSPPNLE